MKIARIAHLAEVASAHGGSAENALKMLEAAFKMGADGIKFQLFRAELLVVRRHPQRKDFDAIDLVQPFFGGTVRRETFLGK